MLVVAKMLNKIKYKRNMIKVGNIVVLDGHMVAKSKDRVLETIW